MNKRVNKKVKAAAHGYVRFFVYPLLIAGVFLFNYTTDLYSNRVEQLNNESEWKLFTVEIDKYANKFPNVTGIYIKNLKNNLSYQYNADMKFISASLIKLPVLCAVMYLADKGEISLDEELVLKRSFKVGGSGRLKYVRNNSKIQVIDLLKLMIKYSDNTAAKMITERIGYRRMNDVFVEIGLVNTNISPYSFCMARWRVDDESYTTPEDIAFLLDEVYRDNFISADMSGLIVGILKLPEKTNRLGRYLPDDFQLAHKTGLLRGACHDAGIVFGPNGDFIICVMTEKNSSYRTAKRFISNIGKLTYQVI